MTVQRSHQVEKTLDLWVSLKSMLDSGNALAMCYLLLIKALIVQREFARTEDISMMMGDDSRTENKNLNYLERLGWVTHSRGFYSITREGHKKLNEFTGLQSIVLGKYNKEL